MPTGTSEITTRGTIRKRYPLHTHRKKCFQCGVEFIKPGKLDHVEWNRRKYCSKKCYTAAQTMLTDAEFERRRKARQKLNNYLRDKKIQRGLCEVCKTPKTDAHHEDYSEPLKVRWFCRKHHHQLHHD